MQTNFDHVTTQFYHKRTDRNKTDVLCFCLYTIQSNVMQCNTIQHKAIHGNNATFADHLSSQVQNRFNLKLFKKTCTVIAKFLVIAFSAATCQ